MRHGSRRTKGSARAATLLTAAAGLAALAAPSVAGAQSGDAYQFDDLLPAGATEADVRAMESMMLGPEHAAEHAAVRAADRGDGSRAVGPGGAEMALSSEDAPAAALAVEGPPSEIGEWTQAPFTLPTYAINSALLPTGKVLFWGRPPRPAGGGTPENVGEAALWSPWLGTGPGAFTDVEPPVIDPTAPAASRPARRRSSARACRTCRTARSSVAGGNLIYAGTFRRRRLHEVRRLANDLHLRSLHARPGRSSRAWPTGAGTRPRSCSRRPHDRSPAGYSDEPPGGTRTATARDLHPPSTLGGQGTVDPAPERRPRRPRSVSAPVHPQRRRPARRPAQDPGRDPRHRQLHLEREPAPACALAAGRQRRAPSRRPVAARTPSPRSAAMTEAGRTAGRSSRPPNHVRDDRRRPAGAGLERRRAAERRPRELEHRAAARTARWSPSAAAAAIDEDSGGGYVVYADGRARQVELYDPATEQLAARAGPAGGPRLSLDRGAAARRPGLLGRRRPRIRCSRTARTASPTRPRSTRRPTCSRARGRRSARPRRRSPGAMPSGSTAPAPGSSGRC